MKTNISMIILALTLSTACGGEGDNTLPPVDGGLEPLGSDTEVPGDESSGNLEEPVKEEETEEPEEPEETGGAKGPAVVHCAAGQIHLERPTNSWAAESWKQYIPDLTYTSDGSEEPHDACAKAQKLREVGYALLSPGLFWYPTLQKPATPQQSVVFPDNSCDTTITTVDVTVAVQAACSTVAGEACGIYPLAEGELICETAPE